MIAIEKIKKAYDKYAKSYDAGTQLQRDLADKLVKAVQADGVRSLKVLDIGCGTGYLTGKLKATGCDISFGMLSYAKNKSDSCYVQSDAAILPFSDSVFDLVVSNAAYQWALNLSAAFKEAGRVLKPGGKFYFSVFNKNTLWQLQQVSRQTNKIKIASSNFPDKDSLFSALSGAGFKTDFIETYSYEKYYNDLWALLGVLKNIGSTPAENKNITGLSWRRVLKQANESYVEKFGNKNGISATYEAFLIKATL